MPSSEPTPNNHDVSHPSGFVGRERELAALREALDGLQSNRGATFLLAGEPGIGKTRLATELAAEAQASGAFVAWGRCAEDSGVPPYWPWLQILRRLRLGVPSVGPNTPYDIGLLAEILPELRRASETTTESAQDRRFELFDAVERWLRAAAAEQPCVFIFDDLHAADLPSLLLLQFVVRQISDAPILIVASYRPADLDRSESKAHALNPIARNATRFLLAALTEGQVAEIVQFALGEPGPRTLAASIVRLTDGNPLFVGELLQLVLTERDAKGTVPADAQSLGVPHGVLGVITERLTPLSAACRRHLDHAAVVGREFDLNTLSALAQASSADGNDSLAEAARAGLIEPAAGQTAAWQFRHELIRQAIYQGIPAAERCRLHQQTAEIIESRLASNATRPAARLAHHYAHAASLGPSPQAARFAVEAAESAMRQWAYEDADDHYTLALQVLPAETTPSQRCRIALAQGYARHRAGRPTAQASYLEAAAQARTIRRESPGESRSLLAEAAVGYADRGLGLLQMAPDQAALDLLHEALALDEASEQSDADQPQRARLLARLAAHHAFPDTVDASLDEIAASERLARQAGDPSTLAMVLTQKHLILWRFNRIAERDGLASEIIELAEAMNDRDLAWQGRGWRVVDRMTVGDAAGVDEDLSVLTQRAEASREPRYLWMARNFRIVRSMWRGAWSEAEADASESLARGADLEDALAQAAAAFQLNFIARELGREPNEALARMMVQRFPESAMIRSLLVTALLDLGRTTEAQTEFDLIAIDNFAMLKRDQRFGALAPIAECCWRLADRPRAEPLLRMITPFAPYNIMYAGNCCYGSAARYIGGLHALLGDSPAAAAAYRRAMERNQAMGAAAPLAWTYWDAARTLADFEPDAASAWRHRAGELAGALGMKRLAAEIGSEATASSQIASTPTTRTATRSGVFRRDGDYWSIGDGNALVRVKDLKGLHYIATLLRQPGTDIHALDLADDQRTVRTLEEPLLDARSRATYRSRLAELRTELDEAEQANDLGRQSMLREEERQLQQELARALGLHGRSRPSGSAVEKARLNVTRAIKSAIRRIAEADRTLGHTFESCIHTGNLCLYRPDPRLPIEWVVDDAKHGQ